MKLQDALSGFLRSRELRCSGKGMENYKYEVPTFVRHLWAQGLTETEEIRPAHVEGYMADCRARGVNNTTLHSYRARVAAFLNWLAEDGHCAADIMAKVYKPRPAQHIRKTYSEEEVRALLEFARLQPMPYWRAFDVALLHLLLDTGIRAGEVAGLNIEDLHEGNRIKVRGKGDKERWVTVCPATAAALGDYLKFRGPLRPSDPVFISNLGSRVTQHSLYQRIRRMGRRIGIDAGVHRFRHSFAVMSLKNGGSVKDLQFFLGHEKLSTTAVYLEGYLADEALEKHRAFSPVTALMQH